MATAVSLIVIPLDRMRRNSVNGRKRVVRPNCPHSCGHNTELTQNACRLPPPYPTQATGAVGTAAAVAAALSHSHGNVHSPYKSWLITRLRRPNQEILSLAVLVKRPVGHSKVSAIFIFSEIISKYNLNTRTCASCCSQWYFNTYAYDTKL